jgi:hypothetical protein
MYHSNNPRLKQVRGSRNKRAVLRTYTDRGVRKASADPRRGEPHGSGGRGGAEEVTKHTNTNICCGFFRAGFRSSDRRRYSGFLSRDLGETALILMGSPDRLSTLLHAAQFTIAFFFQNVRDELVITVSVHILHALNSIGYNLRASHRRHVCNYSLTHDKGAITHHLRTKLPQFLSSLPHTILERLPNLSATLLLCFKYFCAYIAPASPFHASAKLLSLTKR